MSPPLTAAEQAEPRVTWRLAGVHAKHRDGPRVLVSHPLGSLEVTGTPPLADLLEVLCVEELDDDEVLALLAASSAAVGAPPVEASLQQFIEVAHKLAGLVERTVYVGTALLVRLTPLSLGAALLRGDSSPPGHLVLSRYAYLRARSGEP